MKGARGEAAAIPADSDALGIEAPAEGMRHEQHRAAGLKQNLLRQTVVVSVAIGFRLRYDRQIVQARARANNCAGFGRNGGGGNPYSANGVRHGTDAGQPGGSPAFTIPVTEDMCAEISACSGTQTKRGPVYIWHADVDEGAKIAADIATDFIPGVAQAKTAYDAYTRIQNGEDPVEVLAAAGTDAALGLIPGLKAAKKLRGGMSFVPSLMTKDGSDSRLLWYRRVTARCACGLQGPATFLESEMPCGSLVVVLSSISTDL